MIDYGYFTVVVYDQNDKPWETGKIRYPCVCDDIVTAMEALPGGLIPTGMTACQELSVFEKNPLDKTEAAWEYHTWSRYTAYLANNPREHVITVQPTFWLQVSVGLSVFGARVITSSIGLGWNWTCTE